jgi:hypothetical protein
MYAGGKALNQPYTLKNAVLVGRVHRGSSMVSHTFAWSNGQPIVI